MDVLLIRPRDPFEGTRFTRIRTLTLPSVAAELGRFGRVTVVDEAVQPIPDRPFELVGITTDTPHSPRAYAIADRMRQHGATVVMGGTHVSAMPQEALEHCASVVIGEIEGLGEAIVSDLSAGRLALRYRSEQPPDLSRVGVAPVDVLPEYRQHFRPYPVELTRGCRHACRFCFNRTLFGPGFRRRNLDDLVAAIRERPERILLCMDDNLMNDPDHLAAFAERAAPLGRVWGGQSTVEIADDPGLLGLLRASGFAFTFIGLESFSELSLAGEAKRFNDVRRYEEQLARLRAFGVLPFAGIIVGLDGDGPDVFERTGEALRRLAPAACAFTMPVPFPGTAFHRQMEAEGRILCRDARRYDGHHVVVRPARMSAEELARGYERLAASFYAWPAALGRLARDVRRPMNLRRPTVAVSLLGITAGYRRFHARLASTRGRPGGSRLTVEILALWAAGAGLSAAALVWIAGDASALWPLGPAQLVVLAFALLWGRAHASDLRDAATGVPLRSLGVANRVTLSRMVVAPAAALAVCLVPDRAGLLRLGATALLVVGTLLSDGLDGYLARRRREVTRFGTFLDPIADGFLLLLLGATLAARQVLPLWFPALVAARIALLLAGAHVALRRRGLDRMALGSLRLGKLNVAALAACVALGAVALSTGIVEPARPWIDGACLGAAGITLLALAEKVRLFVRLMRNTP